MELRYQPSQTPIDPQEMDGLLSDAIVLQRELDVLEQLNIESALRWTIGKRFTTDQVFTTEFLQSLHRRMFKDVWKWAGKYRRTNKNIGVPWYEVPIATRQLCEDARFWAENGTYPPEELAIRFKHRLVSIHCFPNGNGRHSRIVADVLMDNVFGGLVFGWRGSGLIRPDEERRAYIDALQLADRGEIGSLIDFARG